MSQATACRIIVAVVRGRGYWWMGRSRPARGRERTASQRTALIIAQAVSRDPLRPIDDYS